MPLDPPHSQARFQQSLGGQAWPSSTWAIWTDAFKAGDEVTPGIARRGKDLVKGRFDELKILGNGELTKKLKVSAHRFSKSAAGENRKGRRRGDRAARHQPPVVKNKMRKKASKLDA